MVVTHQAMDVTHTTMQNEIDRLKQFFHAGEDDPDLEHVVYALEDLPADVRDQARMVLDVPTGGSFASRIFEVTTNAAADLYGRLEQVKLLHFLSQYPVTPYIYVIDTSLSRGSRPSRAKLARLANAGYMATINLCAELPSGDAPQIQSAGLSDLLKTYHIPITDGTPPHLDQVMELLRLLVDPQTGRVYLHCEAGKARTGVMIACCRMALMGWSLDAGLLEARNFGCSIPDQLDFIQDFGEQLESGSPALADYPRKPLGCHRLTKAERNATIATAAAADGW